ncbi:MAG: pyridoxamine 5'-phosphate oxidase family protein [Deltaproteobacteria bacterium]|nr:pyridoxamine 5'-phosphate oxidase family protein [Deltaproteobacteria bacterium]
MRRKEFEARDRKLIEEVLRTAEIGYLAFNGPDGWPRITPINFVFDERILWHGAIAGERFECLKRDPRATFAAVSIYLYLPSHFISEENATAATMAFKSVQARGQCTSVSDREEKCAILNRLMEKYQPEGRYQRVSPADPLYSKILAATGVYALHPEEVVGKFKFAQNKPEMDRKKIAAKLKERGRPIDLIIAEEILKILRTS